MAPVKNSFFVITFFVQKNKNYYCCWCCYLKFILGGFAFSCRQRPRSCAIKWSQIWWVKLLEAGFCNLICVISLLSKTNITPSFENDELLTGFHCNLRGCNCCSVWSTKAQMSLYLLVMLERTPHQDKKILPQSSKGATIFKTSCKNNTRSESL